MIFMFLIGFILRADWAAVLPPPLHRPLYSTQYVLIYLKLSEWRSGGGGTEAPPIFSSWRGVSYCRDGCQCMFFWVYFREHVLFYGFYYFVVEKEEEDMWVVLCTVSCRSADLPPSLFLLKLKPVPSPHYSHYSICSYKQLMCPPLLIFLSGFNQFLPPPFTICI